MFRSHIAMGEAHIAMFGLHIAMGKAHSAMFRSRIAMGKPHIAMFLSPTAMGKAHSAMFRSHTAMGKPHIAMFQSRSMMFRSHIAMGEAHSAMFRSRSAMEAPRGALTIPFATRYGKRSAMPHLFFYQRGSELMRERLDRPRTTLGGGPEADVWVPDASLPPLQCAIEREGEDGYALVDLSGQGTLVEVGGEFRPVTRCALEDGQPLRLGAYTAQLRAWVPEDAEDERHTLVDPLAAPPLPESLWVVARLPGEAGPALRVKLAGELVAGASGKAQLQLDGADVSGRHARFSARDGHVWVEDLGSTNGTFYAEGRLEGRLRLPLERSVRIGRWDVAVTAGPAREPPRAAAYEGMVGVAPAMIELFKGIDRVAPTDFTVLVTGETGTGKELVAHAIHRRSARAGKPLVFVDGTQLADDNTAGSELFGHLKGAYTGASSPRPGAFLTADGGTLVLDEAAKLSKAVQGRLLRVLETGEMKPLGADRPRKVDVRVVVLTNRELAAEVAAGRFLDDLYYRLNVATLHVPALRRRKEDLPALWQVLAAKHSAPGTKNTLAPEALEKLRGHDWPGNVRELDGVVKRALLFLTQGTHAGPEAIDVGRKAEPAPVALLDIGGLTLEQIEAAAIARTLELHGSLRAASRALGIARSTLDAKLKKYGLRAGAEDGEPQERAG
ncbi:MAG: sigma 54-interacting transcriptional regulator [Myxococcales bacterium]